MLRTRDLTKIVDETRTIGKIGVHGSGLIDIVDSAVGGVVHRLPGPTAEELLSDVRIGQRKLGGGASGRYEDGGKREDSITSTHDGGSR